MNILDYFKSLEHTYSSLYNELNQELPKLNPELFFDYTKNLTDPFQAITTNPDTDNSILNHLYEWYQSINPNYKPLNTLEPHIPKFRGIQPYRTLLLNMAKDLIILQHTKQFPKPNIPQITNNNKDKKNNNTLKKYNKNNKTYRANLFYPIKNNSEKMLQHYMEGTNNSRNLNTLPSDNFDKIESIINSILILLNDILTIDNPLHYKYLSIILIIDKYLQLFSFGNKTYDNFQTQLFKYNEIPFLIYPTFNPISYTKVIYFMQAPVLNFMMMNTRKVVHSYYEFPYHQVYHDLSNHANKTHKIYEVRDINTDLDTTISIVLKETFQKNNRMINRLKKYINYDIKLFSVSPHPAPALTNINTDHNDNINKFILCYALFFMCHEIGTYDFSSIDTIIKKNITNIYLYDDIMIKGLYESLPSSKYNMEKVISMIRDNSFETTVILQLNKVNTPHKGGKKTNTHHKKTKKKSNRKKLNKLTITNLLKKTHIK